MSKRISVFIFAVFSFMSLNASAQLITGPIATGAGGAGRAAVDPGEAGLLNPASVAHLQRYNVGFGYQTSEHPRLGNERDYSVNISDGSSQNLIPGAFSYGRRNVERGTYTSTEQDFAISVGGFIFHQVALGVTGHRLMSSLSNRDDTQDNIHVGLLITPLRWLGIAVVANDIAPTPDSVPASVRLVPTYSIGANALFMKTFRFRMDIVRPDIQPGYDGRRNNVLVGLESFFTPDFTFQAGTQWRETTDQTFVTVGFGFRGPKLNFDYGFQKDVRSAAGTRHVVDLWMPL